jgi:sirohydrochlorin cobaltochelatase
LPPAGHHPRMPQAVEGCAVAAARDAGFVHATTSLLLVAHGSRRGDGSVAARGIATAIAATGCFAEVGLAFLEEAPHLSQWRQLVQGRDVLVQPLMMAAGVHLERDIPALMTLSPGEDRRITVAPPLGDGAGLADLVNGWCLTNR